MVRRFIWGIVYLKLAGQDQVGWFGLTYLLDFLPINTGNISTSN